MVYTLLIIADDNVVRFWPACQLSRPQLVGVELKSVLCFDTLQSALDEVTDRLDYVLVSMLTGFLIDEGSASDVKGSCMNVLDSVLRPVYTAAKKSSNVQVELLLLVLRFVTLFVDL